MEQYYPRHYVPSKQQISTTKRTFILGEEELKYLATVHRSLYGSLLRINVLLNSPRQLAEAGIDGELLHLFSEQHAPYFSDDSREITFMTTEVILSQERHPYIVSIDAHSARHWEDIAGLVPSGVHSFAKGNMLAKTVRKHFANQEIVLIQDSQEQVRYPQLAHALNREGISVVHQSSWDTERNISKRWQNILELPLMQVRKTQRERLHKDASFYIHPFPHLSSQRMLALLSHPEFAKAFSFLEGVEALSQSIPRTSLMEAKDIPEDAVVKSSAPLASQRCLGRYGAFPSIERARLSRGLVAQQNIHPYAMSVPDSHARCPVHLFFVSYRGELITGMAVAHVPANGTPAHRAALDIEIR